MGRLPLLALLTLLALAGCNEPVAPASAPAPPPGPPTTVDIHFEFEQGHSQVVTLPIDDPAEADRLMHEMLDGTFDINEKPKVKRWHFHFAVTHPVEFKTADGAKISMTMTSTISRKYQWTRMPRSPPSVILQQQFVDGGDWMTMDSGTDVERIIARACKLVAKNLQEMREIRDFDATSSAAEADPQRQQDDLDQKQSADERAD